MRAVRTYAGVGARARSHIRRQPSPVRDGERGRVVVSLFAICQESTGTEAPLSIHLACSAVQCLPFSLIHSPIYTSYTPSRIPRRHKNSGYNKSRRRVSSQQRKALQLVVQGKLITASSEAENLRAEWKMKLTSQTQLTG